MRDAIAIVAPAVDIAQLEREIQREVIALQDGERKESSISESNARRRVDLGRLLIEAKSASKHGTWLPRLERMGIASQTASQWMRLAGFVEEQTKLPTVGNIETPTLRDAGIDKRARKSDDEIETDGVAEWQREIDARRRVDTDVMPHSEFVPVFKRVEKTILKESKAMYAPDRQLFAAWLRNVADEIDPLKGE